MDRLGPIYVVVVTRGRPREMQALLAYLAEQTRMADHIVVVGTALGDIEGVAASAQRLGLPLTAAVSAAAGCTIQRNAAIEMLRDITRESTDPAKGFAVFFDDDFRPAADWLAEAAQAFAERPQLAGLTGHVLADGVRCGGLSAEDARAFLSGARPAEAHWASGSRIRRVSSVYGCNMAFRMEVCFALRFDENLPLYGWQEDRDFTARAANLGEVLYVPGCRGVHLGVSSGRENGVRIGYSQIANPTYLARKGTMSRPTMVRFIGRALISNTVKAVRGKSSSRLSGNRMAIADMLRGRCTPQRIVEL